MEERIYNKLKQQFGSKETTTLTLVTNLKTGKSHFTIEKEISENYPATDYENVLKTYEEITGGGGRPSMSINDFKP